MRDKAKVVLVLMEDDEKLKEERAFAVKTREKTSKSSGGQSLCPPAGVTVSFDSFKHFCLNQPHLKTPSRTLRTGRAMLLGQRDFHLWTTYPRWLT